MHTTTEISREARRIEESIHKLEAAGDPGLVATARELVESLMELHGAGLARMIEMAGRAGAPGREILESFARDELVGSLLLLHGLHPLDLETRVRRALEKLHSRSRSHGGTVELLGIDEGVVRLRLRPIASACGSTSGSLKAEVEEAIYEAAPDVTGLSMEGGEENAASVFVPLTALTGRRASL